LKSESLFERKITAGKENYERTREKKYAVARVAESGEKTEREKRERENTVAYKGTHEYIIK